MFSDSSAPLTALQSAQRAITGKVTDGELVSLSRSPEVKVRAAVAAHPGTPLTILLKMARDPSVDVRIGVASNRRAGVPVELFEDLAKDRNVDVVYALIDNPAVPDPLIARLGRQIHREYAKEARVRIAQTKKGTFRAPDSVAAPDAGGVPDASTPDPHVTAAPSFATVPMDPAVERTPLVPDGQARADAMDVLLGATRR